MVLNDGGVDASGPPYCCAATNMSSDFRDDQGEAGAAIC